MNLLNVKGLLLLFTACLLIFVALNNTKIANRTMDTDRISEAAPGKPSQDPVDEAPANLQVVLFALRSDGFEPAELKLNPGEYLFVIRNRSGLDQVNFRLLRGNNEQVAQGRGVQRLRDWKNRARLTQGTYLLTEMDHPDWTCKIVVAN